jgi:PhnB protein
MPVEPIPSEYPRLMAYLVPRGAARAIEFYVSAFGATERGRMPGPDGTIGHAELQIGDSVLMLADEPGAEAGIGYQSPEGLGGSSLGLVLYVEDVDAVYERAIAAGATALSAPETKFYGDREGRVRDPFGYVWSLMTHVEDVSPEEMQRRAAAAAGG